MTLGLLQDLVSGFVHDIEAHSHPQEVIDIIHLFSKVKCLSMHNGSSHIKVSVLDNETPSLSILSVVGRPRHHFALWKWKDFYVGEEAISKRGVLTLRYPIERGIVTNWDDITELWRHAILAPHSPLQRRFNAAQTIGRFCSLRSRRIQTRTVANLRRFCLNR
jgi:hypothetical protein